MNLFIYIPTYNRPDALKKQLRVLVPQVLQFPERVRLLISDNASANDSFADLEKEFSGHATISLRKNPGNIGGNANISLGFVFARPNEFLWILGDNDIIHERAVEYILKNLDPTIDFYCFNDFVKEPEIIDYRWQDGWEKPMDWRMGLISDGLYNMKTISSSIEDAFFYHNSSFPHLAVGCSAAKKKGNVKFKILPRKNIDSEIHSSEECPTDYTLARVGMLQLIPLFPKWSAKSFSRLWLRKHGYDLFKHRKKMYMVYLHTKGTVLHYGGFRSKLLFYTMWSTAWFVNVLRDLKTDLQRKSVSYLKQNLSPARLASLKKLKKYFE